MNGQNSGSELAGDSALRKRLRSLPPPAVGKQRRSLPPRPGGGGGRGLRRGVRAGEAARRQGSGGQPRAAARPLRSGRTGRGGGHAAAARRCAAAGGHAAGRGGGRAAVRVARKRGPALGGRPRAGRRAPSWRCRDARALARTFSGPEETPSQGRAGPRGPPARRAARQVTRARVSAPRTGRGRPRAVRARGHPPPPPPPPPPPRRGNQIRPRAPPPPDLSRLSSTHSFSSVNRPYRSACPPRPGSSTSAPPLRAPRRGGCPLGGSAAARARGRPRWGGGAELPRASSGGAPARPPAPPRGRPPAPARCAIRRPRPQPSSGPTRRGGGGGEDQNVPPPPPPPRLRNRTSSELPPVRREVPASSTRRSQRPAPSHEESSAPAP